MDIGALRERLAEFEKAAPWLRAWKLSDVRRAYDCLLRIASGGMTLDLLGVLCDQLAEHLPATADPDMALNNLERFVAVARNPLAIGTLFERDPTALPPLLHLFSTSQYLSDLLVTDPESYDLLRLSEGLPVARQPLVDELTAEVMALDDETAVARALRRFKRREVLRIAYGDIIRGQSLKTVTAQISYLADAIVEAALQAAYRKVAAQRGVPQLHDGRGAPRFVVLGLGKLGGLELNYSSDIDLIFLYDGDGRTDGRRSVTNVEFFDYVAREMVRLLTEATQWGSCYRVDLRLRPDGQRGPTVPSLAGALSYYDLRGRTWERQAMIKARPVAGDLDLGWDFLDRLGPWIYRRYLSAADIAGIKALKRRIERQAEQAGGETRDVKTGRGGIRDVEFAIQFLQLLNGGDLPELRTGNTLDALSRLEASGCLSHTESTLLAENYTFLRKIEHRLQIMFDLQTHLLPDDPGELTKLALRMGYGEGGPASLSAFIDDYRQKTELNRKILDHLLHEAFADDPQTAPEVDLVLDPDPTADRIEEVLGKYPFRDLNRAYENLMALGEERIPFLSTRRCRHFLASIAPRLLSAVAETVDPDSTLVQLCQVSDSIGGKGVLWELFSFNPPSLRLYVELCAYSPYLAGILTSNPGMLDGLMDSLVLDKLPTPDFLDRTLAELCESAEDVEPILHSFKNDQILRVGVRDLLGKEDVQHTTGALADIAQTCLKQIVQREYERLTAKFGEPHVHVGRRTGRPCELVILALGKFGGRELNYHSDLDIVFLYEAEGHTQPPPGREGTSNQHFYSELGQRIIKFISHLGAHGRLYEVDARLRPTGRSGSLAVSLPELLRYFTSGEAQLWERQAFTKARVVFGSDRAARLAMNVVTRAVYQRRWQPADAAEIRQMRHRLEQTASAGNLKRGPGGIVDIEFLVQMLQLRHGRGIPHVRSPNTLQALRALFEAGCLSADDYELFYFNYRLLRTIEGRLRLMNSTARDQLPADPSELAKLAHLTRYQSTELLLQDFAVATRRIRERFDQWMEAAARTSAKRPADGKA